MSFTTLAILVAAGLIGPLLAAIPKFGPPLVVGEILAGLLIGKSGFNLVPNSDPALNLLSAIGFALLMLIVGTHLPLRQNELKPALGKAIAATGITAAIAIALAWFLAGPTGLNNPAILAVLITTSSAAVALPVIQSLDISADKKHTLLTLTAWISIADVLTVLAIPLIIRQGGVANTLIGIALIAALAVGVYFLTKWASNKKVVEKLRARSKQEHWAVDLRTSLLVLFVLAAIATAQQTSILIAGFAAGAVLALSKQPRRFAQQLIGLGEGFLVPLFFVTLGAKLDLSSLITSPQNLFLTAALVIGSLISHIGSAALLRLPIGSGMLATAQLGVPAAIASIGLQTHVLNSGQAAAILAAVLLSLIITSAGANILGSDVRIGDHTAKNEGNK